MKSSLSISFSIPPLLNNSCAIIEEIIENMEDKDICKQDTENVANGLLEYIFEVHIDKNLEDYIISKGE